VPLSCLRHFLPFLHHAIHYFDVISHFHEHALPLLRHLRRQRCCQLFRAAAARDAVIAFDLPFFFTSSCLAAMPPRSSRHDAQFVFHAAFSYAYVLSAAPAAATLTRSPSPSPAVMHYAIRFIPPMCVGCVCVYHASLLISLPPRRCAPAIVAIKRHAFSHIVAAARFAPLLKKSARRYVFIDMRHI